MAALTKNTVLYACHQVPLELDVYEASDYPQSGPVVLFFHSGGLVGGDRGDVPPWLVQACYRRKWPLLSASYRLLPQVPAQGLVEDAKAAFNFARTHGGQHNRSVIAAGASGGFFMVTLIASHLEPKPVALLSITGIPTFKHNFFNSSYLIPPEPIEEEEVEHLLAEPVVVGKSPCSREIFYIEQLLPLGGKNPEFVKPKPASDGTPAQDPNRAILYDYYLHNNLYEPLTAEVDPGYDWAADPSNASRLADWPVTIFIQGDEDEDVKVDVTRDCAKNLGPEKGKFYLAPKQGHLYERNKYLEDEDESMDAVRKALQELDAAVTALD
ncbi:alpha/beta-hydrolase [Thozetella sp. PMI_491]|nr:alpha/beta-hydrolase [Thozetella sp. PMI_491]